MKKCTKCKQIKPLTEFGKNKQSKDGITYWCLQCKREYAKDYAVKHRHDPDVIYKKLSFNAINFGKRFVLSIDEFREWYPKQEFKCGYCDLPEDDLKNITDTFIKISEDRLTVDCMDNEVGYANGNLIMSCRRCNCLKSDILDYKQMRYIGQNFIKPIWEKQLGRKLS